MKVAALALLVASIGAHADGTKLLEHCRAAMDVIEKRPSSESSAGEAGLCVGVVQGALDSMTMYQYMFEVPADRRICAPPNMSIEQAIRITVKYASEHPEQLHFTEGGLVLIAMRQAFPCGPSSR